ncbi:Hvo_1808 family surface protein [Salinilacihabitans rarus]|uniref:Hvo_1808 family surface protein n=1 Tax=Salinilacihabitans rarus TaxID=2961596 RepID=UPI0020C8C026|nr:Hvo_1808 family surface protein [Salinilacihabitans rarus]
MRRALLLALLVVMSSLAVPLAAGAGTAGVDADPAPSQDDRESNPTTEDTIGYVEGYWYDDELPVDDREGGTVEDEELEAVIYRSMARVEVIRERTFEEPVPVEVITRAEFENETGELFVDVDDGDRLVENVRYEALFAVDRETDVVDEFETLYGGAVAGYYEPAEDRIVIVSDTPDEPELDEVTLGHELQHALQDQRFGLDEFDEATVDDYTAVRGLVEGEATLIDVEYERRCGTEWECVEPSGDGGAPPGDLNYGLFFGVFHPYSDGPIYVDALREEGGWEAVDAAFDDPPASSAEVIRPGEERDPAAIDLEDRSNDRWEPLETAEGADAERFGEATMAAMFMGAAVESGDGPVARSDVFDSESELSVYNYDHAVTDGWAGDELVAYGTGAGTESETGFVWRSEWESTADAEEFAEGYLALIEANGGDPVEDRRNTYVIDDEFPGAYALDVDGETVTIVRAPSVEELSGIYAGAAPEGADTIDAEPAADGSGDGDANATDSESGDRLAGFGAALAALSILAMAFATSRRE